MILLMASSGMRVGALPILNFGDLTPVPEHQIYQIRVYTDSKSSQCYTFCTPECAKAIDNYLNYRRQSGERITRASPLFRREYNKRSEFDAAKNIRRIKDAAIKRSISKALYDSGLRTPLAIDTTVKLNNRRAIPMDNGFRRFFFTWCRHAGMDKFDIDWCMGHDIGVDESYFKPDPDSGIYLQILEGHHKKAGYLDAIDYLTINEEHRLKRKVELLTVQKGKLELLEEKMNELNRRLGLDY
jgi:hypothetical protein